MVNTLLSYVVCVKGKGPITGLNNPTGFQEVKAPQIS